MALDFSAAPSNRRTGAGCTPRAFTTLGFPSSRSLAKGLKNNQTLDPTYFGFLGVFQRLDV